MTCVARLRPELAEEYADLEREMSEPFRRDLSMAEIIEDTGATT